MGHLPFLLHYSTIIVQDYAGLFQRDGTPMAEILLYPARGCAAESFVDV